MKRKKESTPAKDRKKDGKKSSHSTTKDASSSAQGATTATSEIQGHGTLTGEFESGTGLVKASSTPETFCSLKSALDITETAASAGSKIERTTVSDPESARCSSPGFGILPPEAVHPTEPSEVPAARATVSLPGSEIATPETADPTGYSAEIGIDQAAFKLLAARLFLVQKKKVALIVKERTKHKNWEKHVKEGWFLCVLDSCADNRSGDRLMTEDEKDEHCSTVHKMKLTLAEFEELRMYLIRISWEEELETTDTDSADISPLLELAEILAEIRSNLQEIYVIDESGGKIHIAWKYHICLIEKCAFCKSLSTPAQPLNTCEFSGLIQRHMQDVHWKNKPEDIERKPNFVLPIILVANKRFGKNKSTVFDCGSATFQPERQDWPEILLPRTPPKEVMSLEKESTKLGDEEKEDKNPDFPKDRKWDFPVKKETKNFPTTPRPSNLDLSLTQKLGSAPPSEEEQPSSYYRCEKCKINLYTKRAFGAHMENVHGGE